ncbi:MAG: DNA alkylation repair protein [Candidatus Micrarchaeota archaeon]
MAFKTSDVRRRLRSLAEPEFKKGLFRFFKEQINPIGVRLPKVRRLSKELEELASKKSFSQILSLSKKFQSSKYFEEQIFGVYLIELHKKEFSPATFSTFEKWIGKYVSNWAHCDLFCTHSVWYCIERNPELIKRLPRWTKSKNRWVRRAACVTLIIPAKRGLFLQDILAIAERNVYDPDEMVQKGTGWLLREAAKAHYVEINAFLHKHTDAPRILLRYATEKFPKKKRESVLSGASRRYKKPKMRI